MCRYVSMLDVVCECRMPLIADASAMRAMLPAHATCCRSFATLLRMPACVAMLTLCCRHVTHAAMRSHADVHAAIWYV